MNLYGLTRVQNRSKKRYVFMIVDDYFRFIWTLLLVSKYKAYDLFVAFVKKLQKIDSQLASIRSDHGTKFKNARFLKYYMSHDIDHNFSAPMTPQHNRIVRKKKLQRI